MNKLKSAQIRLFFFTALILFNVTASKAQADSLHPLRIAVLAPLYLDSAFESHVYKLGNTSIPKLFLPGLDFYNGVTMAVDSLQKEGVDLDVWIYDTKKKGQSPDTLAAEIASMNFSLVLASFSNTAEQKIFSAFSFNNNVPLVSATYPNDAYVTGNPYFLMVNTSLRTHAEAIYKYAQRNYPIGKFLYVTRKGSMEDKIQGMFTEAGKKTYPLDYKTVQMPDNFTAQQLLPLLDSNRQNIVICGSLDEKFGTNLIKVLDQSTSYQTVAIGMPTWDGLKAASNTASETLEIVYSTPYHYPRSEKTVADITALHKTKFNGRPSDMVFKGFETMYCFSKLLLKYHNDLLNNLSDGTFKISQNFQFQPAKLNNDAQVPDYIENKKLFFIHVQQGAVKSVD